VVITGAAPTSATASTYYLSIFAGTGSTGSPTPGPAINSDLNGVGGLAIDSSDNVYIAVAGSGNNMVLKVTPAGVLSVVAGTGSSGSPTPGRAASSKLGWIFGVAVDSAGNTYIADASNHVIEKVTPTGTLSIFAGAGISGTPTSGPAINFGSFGMAGLAVDSSDNLYIADGSNRMLLKANPAGALSIVAGTGNVGVPSAGPATNSDFGAPVGVAVDDAGNVYVGDIGNKMILKVNSAGTLSIIAGTGTSGTPTPGPAVDSDLGSSMGIAVDSQRNLYVADYGNHVIEKISTAGTLSIIAGTGINGSPTPTAGPATSSDLNNLWIPAVDSSDNLFVTTGRYVLKLSGPNPSAPTSLTPTPGNGSASIAFTQGSSGGAAITKYQYSSDGGTNWADTDAGTTSPVTISGLTNYTTYSIQIRAVNSIGVGASSAIVAVRPLLEAPSILSVSQISKRRALITWATVPDSIERGTVTAYRGKLFLAGQEALVRACTVTASATSCSVGGLTAGGSYEVAVRALRQRSGPSSVIRRSLDSSRLSITIN